MTGKEYLPAVPLFGKFAVGCSELSRTGGRGRVSVSVLTIGTGFPTNKRDCHSDSRSWVRREGRMNRRTNLGVSRTVVSVNEWADDWVFQSPYRIDSNRWRAPSLLISTAGNAFSLDTHGILKRNHWRLDRFYESSRDEWYFVEWVMRLGGTSASAFPKTRDDNISKTLWSFWKTKDELNTWAFVVSRSGYPNCQSVNLVACRMWRQSIGCESIERLCAKRPYLERPIHSSSSATMRKEDSHLWMKSSNDKRTEYPSLRIRVVSSIPQ